MQWYKHKYDAFFIPSFVDTIILQVSITRPIHHRLTIKDMIMYFLDRTMDSLILKNAKYNLVAKDT